jgi:hypothetical protein
MYLAIVRIFLNVVLREAVLAVRAGVYLWWRESVCGHTAPQHLILASRVRFQR